MIKPPDKSGLYFSTKTTKKDTCGTNLWVATEMVFYKKLLIESKKSKSELGVLVETGWVQCSCTEIQKMCRETEDDDICGCCWSLILSHYGLFKS